jgi:predicted dehydrogenase
MAKVKAIVIGTGGMARAHINAMIGMPRSTDIIGFVEPDDKSRERTTALFTDKRMACPPCFATVKALVKALGAPDAALVCSPHKFHFENARDCLNAGTDVLIEKPMVMNASEARRLIALRDKTERLLMVAFQGSLSPAIWKAKQLLARGTIGDVSSISAFAQQQWKSATVGTWRQIPEISGGGFLFDTGSHMINTIVDLMQSDVARVSALFDNRGTPVEINSSVSGTSASGITFTMAGAGDSVQCASQIMVFGDKGVIKTGIWGESLMIKMAKDADFSDVPYRKSQGPWEQFLRVRDGKMENPCPPEAGLRFAKLMDMIRKSAETGKTVTSRTRR